MSSTTSKLNVFFLQPLLKTLAVSGILRARVFAFASVLFLTAAFGLSAQAQTNFESPAFTTGTVHNQNGWSSLGAAGSGCAVYDHLIVTNNGFAPVSFGVQSLRISNSVTSGCFGDNTFSSSNANEAGESSAQNGGLSGGTRGNNFEFQFSIASAVPGAQQPGMVMSVAPDRGDGARMSYLRFEDLADGIHVFFEGFIDAAPFGASIGDPAGCGIEDDFTNIDIATLSRTAPHTIKFVMLFLEGARNDVVQIYIDGALVTTGTSWEDYFRYCEANPPRTVDSMLFRTGGGAVPGNAGNGFLFDAMSSSSASAFVVDDDGLAAVSDCNATTPAYTTIQSAVDAASAGNTVNVCPGTFVEDVNVNKNNLTLNGSGAANSTISGAIGGDVATVHITANNAEVKNFTITRQGNNTTDWNNPNLNAAGIAVQGLAISGMLIHDNIITGNRTGIDVNNSNGHTIRNNVIDFNRTGLIFRNQTDFITFVENFVTNNWTAGLLFLDGSGGTNVPVQSAANSSFSNNNFSANWYAQIVDRQSGGSLPAPGTTNLKNFRGNWFGTTTPVVTTANSAEPGYAAQIPVAYGGSAVPPGGQPDIAGAASANFKTAPLLLSGTDTNVETTPGRGTFGFQGVQISPVTAANPQGWAFLTETPNGAGSYVGGPASPPLGVGSARLTVDSAGGEILGKLDYAGTRLDQITRLIYSTYQNNNANSAAITFQFNLDENLNDGNTAFQGRLVYEPSNDGGQAVQQNVWQTWNALSPTAKFWATPSANSTIDSACPQANPCTLAQVLASFPNLGIHANPSLGAILFKVGGGIGSSFDGNVDAFKFGINTANTTYDFEPGRPTVTINQASGQADPTSTSPINFTVTFSEPVTGFDMSDVILSGTAGATTKVVIGGPTVYNVAVSGMTGSGTVIATVADSAATSNASSAPSAASTSTDNTVTFFTCNNVSIPTNLTALGSTQFLAPISVDNTTGRGILSFDFTLTYNPAVVTPVQVETAGTLSSGWTITTNNTSGTLVVSGFNISPLSGSGTLLNVRFVASGGIGTTSNLNLTSFAFNEGIPCVNISNGLVTVISGTVSGTITYANAPSTPPVSNTTVNAAGSIPLSTVTDVNGNYTLSGFGAGAYTITPSKANQVNGITNSDASVVAQHVVGFISLNPTQQIAADVTGNGTITSLDAAYIAQFVVNIANPGVTGTWRFIPPNRAYPNVLTNSTGQDYSAILMGEVTGNWDSAGPLRPSKAVEKKQSEQIDNLVPLVTVNAPVSQLAYTNSNFDVLLTASNTTNAGGPPAETIFGYQFDLLYNQSVIVPQATPCEVTGTISSAQGFFCNANTPGLIKVIVFGFGAINGAGTLFKFKFKAIGASATFTTLTIQDFMFNEGVPNDITTNGLVTIVGPSAASVSVGGQLLTATGEPVSKAKVLLTASNGATRTAISNGFGYYRFDDVTVGETYIISVNSKRYTFTPMAISPTDGLSELNLIALP
jgi:hypothetical protein